MRHEFAAEAEMSRAEMSSFYNAGPKHGRLMPIVDSEGRLPRGMSVLVIAGLSALAWAVLVAIVTALRLAI
jgi:hypothetical protein